MSLWVKTNRLVKFIFPKYVWDIPNIEKKVFLTFDDGPIPDITEWTLGQLKKYNAKGTFFCIGGNIQKHPDIFEKIVSENHAVGNHTFNHLKGWKTTNKEYLKNTHLCQSQFTSHNLPFINLFRPPYGKIKPLQSKALRKMGYKIIMWDIISMDFDQTITPEKCLDNVLDNIQSGSIIVFHDSRKAWKNLQYVLPKTLEFLNEKGFVCEKIDYN